MVDVKPGDGNLEDYWKRGKGAAKWVGTAHPWTSLYGHLRKYMADELAKRTASQWFHDVFGYWPGSDVNRVAHGKAPRGKTVGPG